MNKQELTDLFRRLGASEPEAWAKSQIEEGINQLARYLFLREAWKGVVDEQDHSWQQAEIRFAAENEGAPGAGIGPALKRLLAGGADPQDITDIVRVMQFNLLAHVCNMLDDQIFDEPELENFYWALHQVNEEGEVIDNIESLHESLLETDPTGREMRPR